MSERNDMLHALPRWLAIGISPDFFHLHKLPPVSMLDSLRHFLGLRLIPRRVVSIEEFGIGMLFP